MSLVAKALNSVRWTAVATATNVGFNLAYTAIMARLLTPAAFGLVAMAQIAIRILGYFAKLGIMPALVQKPDLSERDIRAALTLSVAVNALLFGLMWLLAPLAGAFFDSESVVPILRGLSAMFVFSGFSAVSIGLLRRRLMFRQLAVLEVVSYICGYGCVGIAAALAGMGAWSLVFAAIGQEAVMVIIGYAYTRHSLRPTLSREALSHFLRFGTQYSVIGFLEYIGSNVDSIVVGRWFGEAQLGIYSRALLLVKLPSYHVGTSINKVLLPVLSSAQHDKEKLAGAYLVGWVLVGSLAGAISISLIPAADDLVLTLLGEQWRAAVPIVQIAAFAVPFDFLTQVSGILCDAQGELRPKLRIQFATLTIVAIAMYYLLPQGVVGIATAMVIAEGCRLAMYLSLHSRRLPLSMRDFARANAAVLFITGVSATSVWSAAVVAASLGFEAWWSVLFEAVAGAFGLAFSAATAWLWLRAIPAFVRLRASLPFLTRIERAYPRWLLREAA